MRWRARRARASETAIARSRTVDGNVLSLAKWIPRVSGREVPPTVMIVFGEAVLELIIHGDYPLLLHLDVSVNKRGNFPQYGNTNSQLLVCLQKP